MTSTTNPAASVLWLLVFLFSWPCGSTLAGNRYAYTYGDAWWQEYEADDRTALLLHFGPPAPAVHSGLAAAQKSIREEHELISGADLSSPGSDKSQGGDMAVPDPATEPKKLPPVNESAAGADTVLDYGDTRRVLKLPPGMRVTPEGRFGAGLACDGTGGLEVPLPPVNTVECWFRVASYPSSPACLLSVADGEAKLLLRPDGRLELKLREPHGQPDAKRFTPEALQLLLSRPAEIVSPNPVPLNGWTHVAITSKPHSGQIWYFDARLAINGSDVAHFLSEGGNEYVFLGRHGDNNKLVIGNGPDGGQGFQGVIDEVRASTQARNFYERLPIPWRDSDLKRPLEFGPPWFRDAGRVFQASFDRGQAYEFGEGHFDLRGQTPDALRVDGIRGSGLLVDSGIDFPRFPLPGITTDRGTIEFWLRPVNWDDTTGYWHSSQLTDLNLTVLRLYGRKGNADEPQPFLSLSLPRGFSFEGSRLPLDPGHWTHIAIVWEAGKAEFYLDGKKRGKAWIAPPETLGSLHPVYAEFGITEPGRGSDKAALRFEIDEVVGYNNRLDDEEVQQARARWMGAIEPIPRFKDSFRFKYSIGKLEFNLVPKLPQGVTAESCTVALVERTSKKPVLGPVETTRTPDGFSAVLGRGLNLPCGAYQFEFQLKNAKGETVAEGRRDWDYREEPWWNSRAGIAETPPPPWTPLELKGRELSTRMTRYRLGEDGLPAQILADGEPLLAAPVQFFEDGKPLVGQARFGTPSLTEATWESRFSGRTFDLSLRCRAEFDGMIRYELEVHPKTATVGALTMRVPLLPERAKRYLYYHPESAPSRGAICGVIGNPAGTYVESRMASLRAAAAREFHASPKATTDMGWDAFWKDYQAKNDGYEGYGFFTHLDLNDMNRGLFWFCDNAAGWSQSKKISAIAVERTADAANLVLNLIAEPGPYQPTAPIVFGLLPHPARPLPDKYRLFNRVAPEVDPRACDIYDAFYPWPQNPRSHSMAYYPAPDPKQPAGGPSWNYAESCIPLMRASKAAGLRTLYVDKAWVGTRDGARAYDSWEWFSGEGGAASLTPRFINYLCWEMDQWIGRDIWDALYLDDSYELSARNLEAGFSVQLPDGSEQRGVRNFAFRELLKRWRSIFSAHGKEPVLIAHHTLSWQYPAMVFCDSTLDGENTPIVSLQSPDWIDSTQLARFEVVQNSRLWGIAAFYMPFIAEGGFAQKEKSQFPRWQWRMARQAQSQFAHLETATVFEGQGAFVYKGYWSSFLAWGGGDPATATFHPYWNNADLLQVKGQGVDSLVSCYKQKGGKVWLIASNRQPEQRTLEIRLDLAALGLPAAPKLRSVDPTFDPPAGEDYLGAAAAKQEADTAMGDTSRPLTGEKPALSDADVENLLDPPDAKRSRLQAAMEPKLDGNILRLPVRAKDYRVLVLE